MNALIHSHSPAALHPLPFRFRQRRSRKMEVGSEWLPAAAFLLVRSMRARALAPPPLSFGLSPLSPLPSHRTGFLWSPSSFSRLSRSGGGRARSRWKLCVFGYYDSDGSVPFPGNNSVLDDSCHCEPATTNSSIAHTCGECPLRFANTCHTLCSLLVLLLLSLSPAITFKMVQIPSPS